MFWYPLAHASPLFSFSRLEEGRRLEGTLLQALFRQSPKRTRTIVKGQLYVDDPVVCARGPREEVLKSFDLLLLWWLVLGLPLAWKKGSLHENFQAYEWIGVSFTPRAEGGVWMELPAAFLENFLELVKVFCRPRGVCRLSDAEKLVGKAGRIAYIVPGARQFVSGLYAALAASKRDMASPKRRLKASVVPTRRFTTSACWMRALVRGDSGALLPLRRTVLAHAPLAAHPSGWVAQFDASTTGGGAVLRCGEVIVAYTFVRWTNDDAAVLNVQPENSAFQSFWEMVTLLLSLVLWADDFINEELLNVVDNTGALQNARQLKGTGVMAAVAREIAWRKERLKFFRC